MSPSLRLLPMFAMPLLLCVTSSCGEEEAEIAPSYLKPSNTSPLDQFGGAVQWFEEDLVVGAPHEGSAAVGIDGDQQDESAPDSGAVYAFYRPRLQFPDDPPHEPWDQVAYIKASNTGAGDRFGYSLAMRYSQLLVVGAPYESSAATGVNGDESDDSAPESGAAYVFRRSGGTWVQEAYLKASNTKAGARFGSSVTFTSNKIVVGAPHEDGAGSGVGADQTICCLASSGALYTFQRNEEGEWEQSDYIKSPNPIADAAFGHSVSSLVDSTLAVGAPYGDEAVYIYSIGNTTPAPPTRLTPSGPGSGFGFSVSTWDGELAVGAPLGDTGVAYVFLKNNNGEWVQQPPILASNADTDDEFGYSVDISGRRLAVGAPGEASKASGLNGNGRDNSAPDSGALYLFWDDYNDKPWRQEYYIKATNSAPGQRFGASVALREPIVGPLWDGAPAIGAPNEASDATGTDGDQSNERAPGSGAVFVYEGISIKTP